jgi:hypothetical protein
MNMSMQKIQYRYNYGSNVPVTVKAGSRKVSLLIANRLAGKPSVTFMRCHEVLALYVCAIHANLIDAM